MIKNATSKELDENQYDAYAYYYICGDFDPDAISEQTGFPKSNMAWRAGDVRSHNPIPQKYSHWVLMSCLEHRRSLEEHVRDVLYQMDKNPSAFLALSQKFDAGMQLVGRFYRYPGLYFEKSIVKCLARYELSVDFDLYFPGPEEFA